MPELNNFEPCHYITIKQASDILVLTDQAVRQLINRKVFKTVKHEKRVYLILDDVLTYYSKKKKIPALSEADVTGNILEPLNRVASETGMRAAYLQELVRRGKITGYVSTDGIVYVCVQSVNRYFNHMNVRDL